MSDEVDIDLLQAQIDQAYHELSARSFLGFLGGLTIAGAYGPVQMSTVVAEYQMDDFRALAPSLEAIRDGDMPERRRFWIERTKKAGKDSDLGACLLWLVAFATRPFYGQVGAADRDQAAIIKDRVKHLLHYNPWLNEYVEIVNWAIKSKNGLAEVVIMAADIGGAHGGTPDILIVNELSHVTKWEFVENLMSNAAGVPRCVTVVATNAGFKGTKVEVWRNAAKNNPEDWYFKAFCRPSPWADAKNVEDEKRRLTASAYRRLWWGEWASGKGDALDAVDIDRCFIAGLQPMVKRVDGWRYVGGLDLGYAHDHSACVVLGVNFKERRIRLAHHKVWAPRDGKQLQLSLVEQGVRQLQEAFRMEWVGYDPAQAVLMAQQLQKDRVPMQELTFTGKNLDIMATTLLQVMKAGQLEAYECEELRRDFGKFNIVEKPAYGFRLEATSDEFGHADVGTALVIALPRAVDILEGRYMGLQPDDDIALDPDAEDEELTEEEVKSMPAELRGIYEMYDEDQLTRGKRK